jgi:hypothetical protein
MNLTFYRCKISNSRRKSQLVKKITNFGAKRRVSLLLSGEMPHAPVPAPAAFKMPMKTVDFIHKAGYSWLFRSTVFGGSK